MKPLIKIAFGLILLPMFSIAQSHYKPGYVINLKGDTLKGFIDYQAWDSNPQSISFKTTLTDRAKQTYSITNATAFSVTGLATYKKYTVSISTDNTSTVHLGEGRDTSFKIDSVFLRVLEKGKNLALYSYGDDLKTRFYIGEAPDYTPTELVFRIYYDLAKTEGRTVNENTYQKQLFALANKYNSLNDDVSFRLEHSNYDKDDLLDIVSKINHLSSAEAEKNKTHAKVSFYAGALLNISQTSSNAVSSYSEAGGVSYTSYLPGVTAGVDLVPDPNGGRIEFRLDASIDPTKMDAKYTLKVSPNSPAELSYNQLGIFFTPQALYNIYNAEDFKFYLGVGLAVTAFSYSNASFQSPDKNVQGFPTEPLVFNGLDNAYLIKAGFRIHKNIDICINYYTAAFANKAGYFALSTQDITAGINYVFGQ